MTIRLEWGATSLMQLVATTAKPYTIAASADGTDFGNPEAVITAIRSRLQNGSLAGITSYDNREGPVFVEVQSATFDGLAAAEAALMAESSVDGFNTLKWSPVVELARTTVFDVVYAKLIYLFNDYTEITQLKRRYRVEFNSLPFGREETLTTAVATASGPVSPVTTTIADGASATGWTATNGSAPAAASGAVSTTAAGFAGPGTTGLRDVINRASAVYYFVDWKVTGATQPTAVNLAQVVTYTFGGGAASNPYSVTQDPAAQAGSGQPALQSGYTRTYFVSGLPMQAPVSGGPYSVGTTMSEFTFSADGLSAGQVLSIDNIGERNPDSSGGGPLAWTTFVDGSSASGWNAVNGSAAASSSGVLSTTAAGTTGAGPVSLNFSNAMDATATPYVYVDWKIGALTDGATLRVTTAGGVVTASKVAVVGGAAAGYNRTYYLLPANATALSFGFATSTIAAGTQLYVDLVVKTNVPPSIGTAKQQARTLAIGGSAPTQAALSISAGTGQTLGKGLLVYTRTASTGFQPPLRQYLVSPTSGITLDTATVSGSRHTLSVPSVYRLPASRLKPGSYALVALVRTGSTASYTVTYSAKMTDAAGADVPESVVTSPVGAPGSTTIALTTDTAFGFVEIANLQLPTAVVASDSDRTITLTITGAAGVEVDDFYLCDLNNGVMSLLDTVGLTRVELRTPSLTAPEESVWGGYANGGGATGLIRQDFRLKSLGQHVLLPGANETFTACTGSDTTTLTAAYYRSAHSNLGAA